MNRADKVYLDSLEVKLKAMHQPHLECPCHELAYDEREQAYDEDEFLRVFGEGDEQQHNPIRTDQVQFDHGHSSGDFC